MLALVQQAELIEQPVDASFTLTAPEREELPYGSEILFDGEFDEDALVLRQIAHSRTGPFVHRQMATDRVTLLISPRVSGPFCWQLQQPIIGAEEVQG